MDAEALGRLLPMPDAIDALDRAFASEDRPRAPLRTHLETDAGTLLLMPSAGGAGVGVKLVTLTPDNPGRDLAFINAVYVLFAADTQEPLAVLDGAALTALRTAAVSGLATRFLANPDASRLVIFGAGVQATSHLDAMRAVRPVTHVTVVSRTPERAEAFAARARAIGLDAEAGDASSVAGADLVCTCTTSEGPLFDGSTLRPGAHVNAVGSYQPHTRELDDETVRRARVVVEDRETAMAEAGDLLIPLGGGTIEADHIVADLSELVRGAEVRRTPEDVTVFESVGMAVEDLAVARAAVDRLGA